MFRTESPFARQVVDAFLDGYFQSMTVQTFDKALLEATANRRLLAKLDPDVAKVAERRTEEELEAEKPLLAAALGVAWAFILRSKFSSSPSKPPHRQNVFNGYASWIHNHATSSPCHRSHAGA